MSQLEEAFDNVIKACYRQGRNDSPFDPPPTTPPTNYEPTPRPIWTKEFMLSALRQWRYMPNKVKSGGGPQGNKVVNADSRCIRPDGSFIDPANAGERLLFARAMAVWLNASSEERGFALEKLPLSPTVPILLLRTVP
jgi:hypothetical protein